MNNIRHYFYIISGCILWFLFLYFIILKLNHSYATAEQTETIGNPNDISFYWIILIVGGIILTTLSYVSIRKYIGHKKVTIKQRNNS